MVMQRGMYVLWSRGSNPTALTEWKDITENFGPNLTFEEVIASFFVMKQSGQHVRIEWIPENAYGNVPKVNPDFDDSEEKEREARAWYGKEAQGVETGFGYV